MTDYRDEMSLIDDSFTLLFERAEAIVDFKDFNRYNLIKVELNKLLADAKAYQDSLSNEKLGRYFEFRLNELNEWVKDAIKASQPKLVRVK